MPRGGTGANWAIDGGRTDGPTDPALVTTRGARVMDCGTTGGAAGAAGGFEAPAVESTGGVGATVGPTGGAAEPVWVIAGGTGGPKAGGPPGGRRDMTGDWAPNAGGRIGPTPETVPGRPAGFVGMARRGRTEMGFAELGFAAKLGITVGPRSGGPPTPF
jgi:hypothetical protein